MPEHCPECGAPVPEGGSCRDHFHALLLPCTADTFGAFDAYEEYADRVTRWAQSVRQTLDAERT